MHLFSHASVIEASKNNRNESPVDERMVSYQDSLHKMEYNREETANRMMYGNPAYHKSPQSTTGPERRIS